MEQSHNDGHADQDQITTYPEYQDNNDIGHFAWGCEYSEDVDSLRPPLNHHVHPQCPDGLTDDSDSRELPAGQKIRRAPLRTLL